MSDAFGDLEGGEPGEPNGHSSGFRIGAAESSATPSEVKTVVQELLRQGFIEESGKAPLFRSCQVREREIGAALEPLDLEMRIDSHRGVVFLRVARQEDFASDGEEWGHPLVRRQRLTLEQSLVVAILRQVFVMHEQEVGVGHAPARIALDELLPQFLTYFEDSGSDAKNESRLSLLVDQLKTYGIVSEVDRNNEITIRPLIAHLANPESLAALVAVLRKQADPNEPEAELG
jgi:hypothetical protein